MITVQVYCFKKRNFIYKFDPESILRVGYGD